MLLFVLWVSSAWKKSQGAEGVSHGVKDARLTQTYSFLPASWAGDTHKETDFLPIGDREEKGKRLLYRHTDSLGTMQVLMAKYLADESLQGKTRELDC